MSTHDWVFVLSFSTCGAWVFGLYVGIEVGKRRARQPR
jgi:hypothetical protein